MKMRILKFRAWDREDELMIYSFSGTKDHIWQLENEDKGLTLLKHEEDNEGNHFYPLMTEYDLMQYTGYLDVMAVEIFEDDILEAPWSQLYKVCWSVHYAGWVIVTTDNNPMPFNKIQISLFKIIGNIHTHDYFKKTTYNGQ